MLGFQAAYDDKQQYQIIPYIFYMSYSFEVVNSLADLLVCTNSQCNINWKVVSKQTFQQCHSKHSSQPFIDTTVSVCFNRIAQLDTLLTQNISIALSPYCKKNSECIPFTVLCSYFVDELYKSTEVVSSNKQQYSVLKQLSAGIPFHGAVYISKEVYEITSRFNQLAYYKALRRICQPTIETKYLHLQLNAILNITPLQIFIEEEQIAFNAYLDQIAASNTPFDISIYIKDRNEKNIASKQLNYTKYFTIFLQQKYSKNIEQQSIFTTEEYEIHFWRYFYILLQNDVQVCNCINYEMQLLNQYLKLQQTIQPSLLAFRMWRYNNYARPFLPNSYFIDAFVCQWVQKTIVQRLVRQKTQNNNSWFLFASFLAEYADIVREEKKKFDFGEYSDYYEFRCTTITLQETLQKKQDCIFDSVAFVKYLKLCFLDNRGLGMKQYERFRLSLEEENIKKKRLIQEAKRSLIEELMKMEGFYEFLFESYYQEELNKRIMPTKERYFQYCKNVFEKIDEQFIKEENEMYLAQLKKQKEIQINVGMKYGKEQGNIIDQDQQEMIEELMQQADQESCLCCKGNPYECLEPSCQAIGFCTTCSID